MPRTGEGACSFSDVEQLLSETYGTTRWRRHDEPMAELVATVLSQHTSDTNSGRAFASLRTTFASWEDVRSAPIDKLRDAIRSGGMAGMKAVRIQRILDEVASERGERSLDGLASLGLAEARTVLLELPGVGPKTAACVLLFSLGFPALPVDTHVHRVALRLGLIPVGTSAEAAHGPLEARLGGDRDRVYAFHINAIAHGRAVCRSSTPLCGACPLRGCCEYVLARRGD